MCLLLETIRIEHGVPVNLTWHEQRMIDSHCEIWPSEIPLLPALDIRTPVEHASGTVRCSILYGPGIQSITFSAYTKKHVRSLKMVVCDSIDYHLKYADRSLLSSLLAGRGAADEIVVVRSGFMTDTSMSNLIFFDGVRWSTPANPLLKGTCRNRLVAGGLLEERDIRPQDLNRYVGFKLINAMRDPGNEEMIPVSEIY
jgi:4-amino-4-deoxychorismate lyase